MLRVGLIGAGGIAHTHAECYRHIPEAKVVAVADLVPERADELAAVLGAEALYDGDEIIRRPDVDVVDICVPTVHHCHFTELAARAGKQILCEKPIALNIEQGLRMIDAAEKHGVKLMIAQVLRYFPENVSAKSVMDRGLIGKPVMVRTYRGGVHPDRVRKWYGLIDISGGAIQDTVIHDIDFLKWCFGPVKEVFVKGNTYRYQPHLEYDLLTMEFANGVLGHLTVDWSRPESGHFATRMEIVGTEGIVQYNSDDAVPLQVLQQADPSAKGTGVAIPESPLVPRHNPYAREIIAFLQSVEQGTEPPIPPREALESLNVALAALRSERTGHPVTVKGVF